MMIDWVIRARVQIEWIGTQAMRSRLLSLGGPWIQERFTNPANTRFAGLIHFKELSPAPEIFSWILPTFFNCKLLWGMCRWIYELNSMIGWLITHAWIKELSSIYIILWIGNVCFVRGIFYSVFLNIFFLWSIYELK